MFFQKYRDFPIATHTETVRYGMIGQLFNNELCTWQNGHRDKFRCYRRFHDQGRSSDNFDNLVNDELLKILTVFSSEHSEVISVKKVLCLCSKVKHQRHLKERNSLGDTQKNRKETCCISANSLPSWLIWVGCYDLWLSVCLCCHCWFDTCACIS